MGRGIWVALISCALALGGWASASWQTAKATDVSKLTVDEALAVLAAGSSQIYTIRVEGMAEARFGTSLTAHQSYVELRSRFERTGTRTLVVRFPFAATPLPVEWRGGGAFSTSVNFPGGVLYVNGGEYAQQFVDALETLRASAAKGQLVGQDESDRFSQVVAQYQSANPKPALPEDVRRLQVQAESALNRKQYGEAIDRYEEALRIAPWWANGHFNRALLLLGEAKRFIEAVSEMKKYLALEPGAKDARGAQDKVYQWEGEARRQRIEITVEGGPAKS
jgi:tetratricopeptide (TPR) repeat protein